jgi:Uma2 family endonuclease
MTVTRPAMTWPPYRPNGLLTLADWEALPPDTSVRAELVEGVVLVMNRPVPRHQHVLMELAVQLRAAAVGRVVLPAVELVIDDGGRDGGPATVREPDLVVAFPSALDGRPRLRPDDVLAVIEILSPGTRRIDRVAKLAEYAEVGIPHYVIVDPDGPITEFVLDGSGHDQAYRLVATHDRVAPLAFGPTLSLPV